jgi:biopolymer transport protein ExbB/TolQ
MEFLKKSWKWIIGFISFFIGLVWFINVNTSKKVKKIKKDIKANEKKTKEVDKKIDEVKKKKKNIKKNIKETDKELKKIRKKPHYIKKKTASEATSALKKRIKKKN